MAHASSFAPNHHLCAILQLNQRVAHLVAVHIWKAFPTAKPHTEMHAMVSEWCSMYGPGEKMGHVCKRWNKLDFSKEHSEF